MRNRVWDMMQSSQVASLHAKFQSRVNIYGLWDSSAHNSCQILRFSGVSGLPKQYKCFLSSYDVWLCHSIFYFSGILGEEVESWACQACLTGNYLTGTRRRGICWLQYPADQRKQLTAGIDKEKWRKNITRPNLQTTDSWSQGWTREWCSSLDQQLFPSR